MFLHSYKSALPYGPAVDSAVYRGTEWRNTLTVVYCVPLPSSFAFQGNVTFACSEPPITPITFDSFNSSYLLLPGIPQLDGLSVSFQFRTWNEDGLLLSTELSEDSGSLLLYLHHGRLALIIQKASEKYVALSAGTECLHRIFTEVL